MEVTKTQLIDIIREIGHQVDQLISEIEKQNKQITELKSQNQELKRNNQATLDKIKEYIQELKQIRTHYVDNNNNTKQ